MSTQSKKFGSRWGFILASVGSAVGMANVWGFPYKLGSYGGGAFLLIYLFFIFIFGYAGLTAEFTVGRWSKTGSLGTYSRIWSDRFPVLPPVVTRIIGWIPVAGMLSIAIGYGVIVAYMLKGLTDSLTGTLMTVNSTEWLESFSLTEYSVIPYHIIVVVVTLLTMFVGVKGLEKSNKIMMPVFFVIFIILAIRISMMPGMIDGYIFMFTPRWEYLVDPMVWIWAMGQAFFSLSLVGCGMIVYGAYLPDDEDVVAVASRTALFDTLAAMVASCVVIPACFAYGLDVASGTGLLFEVLPNIFQDIPFGQVFAIILYLAMVFAGISSLQNMYEAVSESITFRFPKVSRTAALVGMSVVTLAIGINMEAIYSWGPFMDLVSIYIIPIGATMGAVTWFWVMKKETLIAAVNQGAKKPQGALWYNIGRYLFTPMALILCIIALSMKIAF